MWIMQGTSDEWERELYAGYRQGPRAPLPEMHERFGKEPSKIGQKRHVAEARRILREAAAKATIREQEATSLRSPHDHNGERFPDGNSGTHLTAS
jgi:hypothetical protein